LLPERDVAPAGAPARPRRAVRAVPPARAPMRAFPRLAPSQGRTPQGRARTKAPRGQCRPVPRRHSRRTSTARTARQASRLPRSAPWHAGTSRRSDLPSIRSRSRSLRVPSLPQATAGLPGRHGGLHGELLVSSHPDQIEHITTTVDLHPNLPNRLLPRRRCSLAGAVALVAVTAPLRRPRPPVVPLPKPSTGIESQGPEGRSPPAPGRSRPPVRRNLAGPPPAGARGLHCKVCDISGGVLCKVRVWL
jgi:hypothetical protein